MRHLKRYFILLSLAASTACAGGNTRPPSGDRDLITRPALLAGSYSTAYDAVRALHPNWLNKRTANNNPSSSILVYVDGAKYGDVTSLRNVPAATIESIRRIDATAATMRWGTGHSEGVLYITSINRR